MKRKLLLTFFILISSKILFGQGQGYNWCFGDSANIKFIGGTMVAQPFSATQSSEANASISDESGNLLFYVGSKNQTSPYLSIFNKNHQVMVNGDSLYGYISHTNGTIIIPFPEDSNKYYVFTIRIDPISPDSNYYLYEQVIDMSLNSGEGELTQKNTLLLKKRVCEKMAVVKHGNGRDWWFMVHDADSSFFYSFLINSNGVENPTIQLIGSNYIFPEYGRIGEMIFSNDGKKLVAVSNKIIDYFEFNRCTGNLSNYISIAPLNPSTTDDFYYGCSFSPSDSVLYVSDWVSTLVTSSPVSGDLYQFDLTAPDIRSSRQSIFSFLNSDVSFGQHQIAPDGKIYIITGYRSVPNQSFDSFTMNLNIINFPNVLGTSCGFNLGNFYLNGHRALLGLPNMPNYNLGPLTGSPCDTITSAQNLNKENIQLNVNPNPFITHISITIQNQKNNEVNYKIQNILGQVVFQKQEMYNSSAHTINLSFLSSGIYVLHAIAGNHQYLKKIVKQ